MVNDPAVQTAIVGAFNNVAGALIALYLWRKTEERYMLFWGLAWLASAVRWVIHGPAEGSPTLQILEYAVLFPLLFYFTLLGSYDLLPTRPWRHGAVAVTTGVLTLAYGIAAMQLQVPIEMMYMLATAVFVFASLCLWRAYLATRLGAHIFAAVVFLCWGLSFGLGLLQLGHDVAISIVSPLFNVPAELALVVIALQRRQRQLSASEHTLQKIFDNAPTPIVITRRPRGEIERANALAFQMLGLTPGEGLGRTTVEHGLLEEFGPRRQMYAELEAGRAVIGAEMVINRAGEPRTLSIHADLLDLDDGARFIFSFFDLTDLRNAEARLHASNEEMRRLYLRLGTVEEDERRSLHRELHDRIGANLSALRLELDLVKMLVGTDLDAARTHLDSATRVTHETIVMSRDLMAELRPPSLDDYGLIAALRSYTDAQARRTNVKMEVTEGDLDLPLSPFVETALFRIAQEALTNATNHASATCVRIGVTEEQGRVVMVIEDDGVGFEAGTALSPGHWGLRNMSERARAIGATLRIRSAPGAGTRITLDLPSERE